jgi:hypothetical protein
MISVVEGQILTLYEQFVDEFDDPLLLSNQLQGPSVKLLDTDRSIIVEILATPDLSKDAGTWIVNLPVPKLSLVQIQEHTVIWTFVDSEGQKHTAKTQVIVEPEVDRRQQDILVLETDLRFEFSLPIQYNALSDQLTFDLYRNNLPVYTQSLSAQDPSVQVKLGPTTTGFVVPASGTGPAKLEPMLFLAKYTKPGSEPRNFSLKLWCITPQILVAASMVEDHINKARLENIIPELEYTQADIIGYLQRGLSMFNGLPTHLSSFTGTNMQGPILDAWLICSCYYALAAQLQAEGAMAFDFSGQTTSLNIDRTPSIEAALGRIENLIENQVKPLKKLLAKSGVLTGSGADGGQYISTARNFGTVQIANAPTSRLGAFSGGFAGKYRIR